VGASRGMKRDGRGGKNRFAWESKYGSLIVSAYDIGTAEGMNEKGLVVKRARPGRVQLRQAGAGDKVISLSTWPQYVLDNFAPSPRPSPTCARRSSACDRGAGHRRPPICTW